MGKFFLGVIFTVVVLALGAFIVANFGLVDMRADQTPSKYEKRFAMGAMDASVDRHAPEAKNPIEPNEANLRDGMHIYMMNCAECHGDPKTPESPMGTMEYPPAPQFMTDAADMPENQNFFIIKHGVRWTAMPGWQKSLSEQDIWKVTTFLSHMEKLPPAVEADWKGTPPAAEPGATETKPATKAMEKTSHHHM